MGRIAYFRALNLELVKVFEPTEWDITGIKAYKITWCLVNPKTHIVTHQFDNISDALQRIEKRLDSFQQSALEDGDTVKADALINDNYKFMELVLKYHPDFKE